MTSTFTPNTNWELQALGDNPNAWGTHLNDNVFSVGDLNLGGRLSISVAGSSDVTPSQTQANNLHHTLTGILTGNINYILPNKGRFYFIYNNTTGAFSVTVKPAGGTGIVVPQGARMMLFTNPTAGASVLPLDTVSALNAIGNVTIGGTLGVTGQITGNLTGNVTGNASTATSATSATSATTATNATNVGVTDDTTTNATFYPLISAAASSNNAAKASSSKLFFNPSTGLLSATGLAGAGSGITALNAANLASGTIPVARLGSGTTDSTTILYGDSQFRTAPSSWVKAWVTFNGATQAIAGSFNVSSVTRNGTGIYTVNFASTLTDANYAMMGNCVTTASNVEFPGVLYAAASPVKTTSAVKIAVGEDGNLYDQTLISVVIVGN